MQRRFLGLIALVLLVIGLAGTFTDALGVDSRWWGGVTLRTGALLGVFWLVFPKARQVTRPVWVGIAVVAAVIAARPRLAAYGLGIAFFAMVAVAMAQRRAAPR